MAFQGIATRLDLDADLPVSTLRPVNTPYASLQIFAYKWVPFARRIHRFILFLEVRYSYLCLACIQALSTTLSLISLASPSSLRSIEQRQMASS